MSSSVHITDANLSNAIHSLFADLAKKKYQYYTATPETHQLSYSKRVKLAEPNRLVATSLGDLWGWSIPARRKDLQQYHSEELITQLVSNGLLIPDGADSSILIPKIRVSCLYHDNRPGNYYVHSAWPTTDVASVFFGPDSYRYMRYMSLAGKNMPNPAIAIDMCTGAGVGAIHLARMYPRAKVYGIDINPTALSLANINAVHQLPGRDMPMIISNGFSAVKDQLRGQVDIVAIDPPFIAGDERTYAAGGPTGIELTMRLVEEAGEILRVGGEVWLQMASPITFDGRDAFKEACEKLPNFKIADYDIIDVDIFGNEMENPNIYQNIGRLASAGVVLRKTDPSSRPIPRAPIPQ